MKKIEPKTLKGFRDFLPKEAKKRQYVVDALKRVFELYGFEPLETPTLEYEEILMGKYGEEGDKLLYQFTDKGGRNVAMRYDQTVPLARVVAQYQNELPMPFKRYQIQNVWRAENTQKGRFREFLQCDADIVGSSSALSDAEIIGLAAKSLQKLGFKNFKILINDRENFSITSSAKLSGKDFMGVIRTIDKLNKIGREKVAEEISRIGVSKDEALKILDEIENRKQSEYVKRVFGLIEKLGVEKNKVEYYPTLARGLDYYTGMIFEIEIEGYTAGSVCGGGRYDNLIGMFAGKQIPAVGFSFGFDRLIEAMEEQKLFPPEIANAKVLVTVFDEKLLDKSIEILKMLRDNDINSEIFDDPTQKLDKQIKYANRKKIPYIIIIGPEEAEKGVVTVRSLETRQQQTIKPEDLPNDII